MFAIVPEGFRKALATAALALAAVTGSEAYALCTFGGSAEPSLQATFDSLLGAATVHVQTACLADGADGVWTTVNQLGGIDIKIELAGNASTNTFGVYDPVNGSLFRIFEGNDSAGGFGAVRVVNSVGQWWVQVRDDNDSDGAGSADTTAWSVPQMLSTSAFGFYLGTATNGTFYSQTARNADGLDHMYAYGALTGNPEYEGTYMLAWEDLFNGQDRDYQDFVANLIDINPVTVPLPPAVLLLVTGLLGLGTISRRHSA